MRKGIPKEDDGGGRVDQDQYFLVGRIFMKKHWEGLSQRESGLRGEKGETARRGKLLFASKKGEKQKRPPRTTVCYRESAGT